MRIYGIGRALVDYYVDSEPQEQASGGSVHMGCAEFDRLLSRAAGKPPLRQSGGSGCNTLKTLARLGHSAVFTGTVGSADPGGDAEFLFESLRHCGVKPLLRSRPGRTGRCLIAGRAAGGSGLVAASPGVSSDILAEQVAAEEIAAADWLLAEGMETDNEGLWRAVLRTLRESGTPLAILCGTKTGAERTAAFIARISAGSGNFPPLIVFANDSEARILEKSGVDIARVSLGGAAFVITHGCGGSSAYLRGKRITAAAVPAAKPLDATGAGDVFAGAFLHSLGSLKNKKPPFFPVEAAGKALEHGAAQAAKILSVPLCDTEKALG